MRAAGLSKDQLAARLHWTSSQVTRPFDGRRAARLRLEEDEGMGRTVTEVIDALPPARRAKIEARAAELIAEESSLQEI